MGGQDEDLQVRMERLELRVMDLEHTLEVLNHATLDLQRRQARQSEALERLDTLLRRLSSALPARSEPDPPPPHY